MCSLLASCRPRLGPEGRSACTSLRTATSLEALRHGCAPEGRGSGFESREVQRLSERVSRFESSRSVYPWRQTTT